MYKILKQKLKSLLKNLFLKKNNYDRKNKKKSISITFQKLISIFLKNFNKSSNKY